TYIVDVKHDFYNSEELSVKLRCFKNPIIVRVKSEAVLLDFRTVNDEELEQVIKAFLQIDMENLKYFFGGIVWESNPPETSRASQMVLKTKENSSTSSDPVKIYIYLLYIYFNF